MPSTAPWALGRGRGSHEQSGILDWFHCEMPPTRPPAALAVKSACGPDSGSLCTPGSSRGLRLGTPHFEKAGLCPDPLRCEVAGVGYTGCRRDSYTCWRAMVLTSSVSFCSVFIS